MMNHLRARSGIPFNESESMRRSINTQDIPGIARFKLGAGAQVKTLCGTWFGR